MSRTDAHAPYWTWATWYEPSHHLWCPTGVNRHWQKRNGRVEPCNLPERPVRHAGVRTRVHVGLCTWEPVWPRWRESRKVFGNTVPRWYVQHVWHNPERVRVRNGLNKIRKFYNSGDRGDMDFGNWQHRHGAIWHWD